MSGQAKIFCSPSAGSGNDEMFYFSLQLCLTAELITEEMLKLNATKENTPKKKKVKRLVDYSQSISAVQGCH